ncbi:MAG: hypothetical protein QXT73_02370 [Candidatus Methanomethylicaceae archaeon]
MNDLYYEMSIQGVEIYSYEPHRGNLEALDDFAQPMVLFALKHGCYTIDVYNPHGNPMDVPIPPRGIAFVFWSLPAQVTERTFTTTITSILGCEEITGGASDSIQPQDFLHLSDHHLIWNLPEGYTRSRKDAELLAAVDIGSRVVYITNDLIHSREGLDAFTKILSLINLEREEEFEEITLEGAHFEVTEDVERVFEEVAATPLRELCDFMRAKLDALIHDLQLALERQEGIAGGVWAACTTIKRGDYSAEVEKILCEPSVERVIIREGEIDVYTHPIFTRDPYKPIVYHLGRYRLEMTPTSVRRITNLDVARLTGQVEVHHAHVFNYGESPCFGNATDILTKCLELGNLGDAVKLLIQFLRAYPYGESYVDNLKLFPAIPLEKLPEKFPTIDPQTLLPSLA